MSDEVRERLDSAVLDLDTTIRDIRSTIFELQRVGERSLRSDVRDLAKEYVPVLGFTPLVRTTGPLDTAVGEELGEQLLAVLREALSNTARHAEASAAVVEIEVTADRVLLSVTDNGKGIPAERQESGLRNVRRRAADHGGAARHEARVVGSTGRRLRRAPSPQPGSNPRRSHASASAGQQPAAGDRDRGDPDDERSDSLHPREGAPLVTRQLVVPDE